MYDEKTVGKRMMELACGQRRWIQGLSSLIGFGVILASLFAEDWSILLVGIIVGVLEIVLGFVAAEIISIKLFGMGVMVDRMAHLKPEFFASDKEIERERAIAFSNTLKKASASGGAGEVNWWQCPKCGHRNHPASKECGNCFAPKN